MRTERDGINVHGNVQGFTGEDLHFENQGDDVYAVWGAGGGRGVAFTGLGKPEDVDCGLSNTPATDIVFRRVFAGPGTSSWSSCAHVFGAGRVVYDELTCCATQSPHPYPAVGIADTFCPDYHRADITVKGLRWFDNAEAEKDWCADATRPTRVGQPTAGTAAGWKGDRLHTDALGC